VGMKDGKSPPAGGHFARSTENFVFNLNIYYQ